jgi:large subunit ribosomal protein L21
LQIFMSINSYAILDASGRQFWVEEGRFYDLDKLPLNPGEAFAFNRILLVKKGPTLHIGSPFLEEKFTVQATVIRHLVGPKVRVYKMRPKKKTRKTFGSRSKLTRVLVRSICSTNKQPLCCL